MKAARAQSAPTCLFDAGTRTLVVTVDGLAATLSVSTAGAIKLNNVKCEGATTTTTDLVQINGSAFADKVTLVNPNAFAPGATAEGTGLSEIEIWLSLGDGDTVTLSYTNEAEQIYFNDGLGLDVFVDGDRDVTFSGGIEILKVKGNGGDDIIDGGQFVNTNKVYFYGGDGNDRIDGAPIGTNRLYGEDGDDELHGRGSVVYHYGGPGNDVCYGGATVDIFVADATYDGDDEYDGGDGRDTMDYSKRTNGVSVTPDDGLPNDGEPGVESDYVDADVENLTGGAGADTLVGTSAKNKLIGNAGADSLYGGPEKDSFYGGPGGDTIFNDDGVTETVDCGPGTDDAQPDNDNFTACELI